MFYLLLWILFNNIFRCNLTPTVNCHHCSGQDSANHTLSECPAWEEERQTLMGVIGGDLSLSAVVRKMLVGERSWNAVASFCESVMVKEIAEREREKADPTRRRRR
ncbi:hypothetical protein O3G_MSEX000018 [Manduca sexta]|nr:hypothetical protein O3G_MSEX000018 [Manduca sexta]